MTSENRRPEAVTLCGTVHIEPPGDYRMTPDEWWDATDDDG